MKRKISGAVTTGIVLAAVISMACAAGEDDQEFMDTEADNQQVCVQVQDNGDLIRDDDGKCPDENEHHAHFTPGFWYWYYMSRTMGTPPAVGQKVTTGGTFIRPTSGSIAKPPSSGGFGTFRAPVGS